MEGKMKRANLYAAVTGYLMNTDLSNTEIIFKRENSNYVYYAVPVNDEYGIEVKVKCNMFFNNLTDLDLKVEVQLNAIFNYHDDPIDQIEFGWMEVDPRVGNIIRGNINKAIKERKIKNFIDMRKDK